MDRARLRKIAQKQGITLPAGRMTIDVDQDLGPECRFVDFLLANALRRGRCARILRNLMVVYAARISLRDGGRDHLFDPRPYARRCECSKAMTMRSTRPRDRFAMRKVR